MTRAARRREPVCLVLSGGASHVVTLNGAVEAMSARRDVVAAGGASAGAIVAAAEAFALSTKVRREFFERYLARGRLLDRAWNPLDRWGVFAGETLHGALVEVFGGARAPLKMREAVIPLRVVVCDLWTRRPVVISSDNPTHGDLLVADVLRASAAIPVFFKAWRLGGPFGARTFVDGGAAKNFPMQLFDDLEPRTIGVRLRHEEDGEVVPVRDLGAFARAVGELVMWASSNAHVSSKRWQDVVTVDAKGSGLDFDLRASEVERRHDSGFVQAHQWMDADLREVVHGV